MLVKETSQRKGKKKVENKDKSIADDNRREELLC